MNHNLTDITFLLDHSGSMNEKKTDVVGGYNQFIHEQTKASGVARFSFVQFDSLDPLEVIHDNVLIGEVPKMTSADFRPRGSTPLYDALGMAIVATGVRLLAMEEGDRPGRVVFVVLTDGFENASEKYTKDQVKKMIQLQQDTYQWVFMFLGVGIDAMREGGEIGISAATTADCSETKTSSGITLMSAKLATARHTGLLSDFTYTDSDRASLK